MKTLEVGTLKPNALDVSIFGDFGKKKAGASAAAGASADSLIAAAARPAGEEVRGRRPGGPSRGRPEELCLTREHYTGSVSSPRTPRQKTINGKAGARSVPRGLFLATWPRRRK
jgi:hypothetical protein